MSRSIEELNSLETLERQYITALDEADLEAADRYIDQIAEFDLVYALALRDKYDPMCGYDQVEPKLWTA